MSISVKNINFSIGATNSDKFKIKLDGALYHLDNFQMEQRLMQPVKLTFTLFKDPVEDINEPMFSICSSLIGQKVKLTLQTESIELEIANSNTNGKTADIEFEGFIAKASSHRIDSQQAILVEALSKDAALLDHPRCQIFNEETLEEIVKAIYEEEQLDTKEVQPENKSTIFYTAQYNETHYDFLRRQARRHCEWFFSTGTRLHFGKLNDSETIQLSYPSKDVPEYGVRLQTFHSQFLHVGLGYNTIYSMHDYADDFKEDTGNALSDATFKASKENYPHQTSLLAPATLESDDDAGKQDLDAPIFCEDQRSAMLSQRANMLIYEGQTLCSRLHIGATLCINDNYISNGELSNKSMVQQDGILITEVVHTFNADEQYENTFKGITAAYPHPPYEAGPTHPICNHPVIADVVDTEDPKHWGRVKLRFPWQRNLYKNKHKNGMTPWIHILQPYTLGEAGVHLIPEKWSQVLVDFEAGNFERPHVLGTRFTPPFPVDENWYAGNDNLVKAIRTASGHTIEIHDANGTDPGGFIKIYDNTTHDYEVTLSTDSKLIKLKSSGNIELEAGGDIKINAGNNITVKAGNNIKTKAGNDITTRADNNLSSTSGNDTSIAAENDLMEVADNDMRVTAAKDKYTNVGRNDTVKISENQQIEVGSNQNVKITQKQQTQAMDIREEASNSIEIQSMSHTQKASTTMSINANASIDIKAAIVKVN